MVIWLSHIFHDRILSMRYYDLFIDESGNVNPVDKKTDAYVLCGCAVEKDQRIELKTRADQIKYKYWGRTNITFHSRDIGKRSGQFDIFQNKKQLQLYKEFLQDVFAFLKEGNYTIFVVVCDKSLARKFGWNSIKVTKSTARVLFYHYIVWLLGLKNDKGKITVESATAEKDRYYLNEFSYFLSPGCRELSVEYTRVRSVLTSLSFVTKHNSDIEEEIADLYAYAASCRYYRQSGKDTYKTGTYEDHMIRALEKKLFTKPRFAKENKMKFYEAIEPFCVVPKT